MRITRDIVTSAEQMNRDIKTLIKTIFAITFLAVAAFISLNRQPTEWRTIIHLRTQDPQEVQNECNRWVMQPGVQKVQSKRQPDGTTHIVLVARK